MTLNETIKQSADYLQSWVEFQREKNRLPGVQVAIRVGEELVASFACGVANVETSEPLRTDHLFHIASLSKTFTATAVFQLVQDQALRLDDTVAQWIPELVDSPSGEMTVRELLGHQSGISRDSSDCDHWQLLRAFPGRDGVLAMAKEDAIYGANEHFKYSNVGYSLLGEIIAAASGMSYEDYVTRHIVDVLGLTRTGPEMPVELDAKASACHTRPLWGEDVPRVIAPTRSGAMAAATGFYSTAEETSAYMAAHAFGRDELLSDASKRLMQRQETSIEGGGYGLGLQITEYNGRKLVGHSGGWPGHITRTWLDPKSGLCVSVLTNAMHGPASEWASALVGLIDAADKKPTFEAPEGIDLDGFAGRYAGIWGIEDVAVLGKRLVALAPAGLNMKEGIVELEVLDADTLKPEAKDGYGMEGELMHFVRRADGSVESMRHGATSWPLEDFRAMVQQGWVEGLAESAILTDPDAKR